MQGCKGICFGVEVGRWRDGVYLVASGPPEKCRSRAIEIKLRAAIPALAITSHVFLDNGCESVCSDVKQGYYVTST